MQTSSSVEKEIVKVLRDVVAINTSNPPGNETALVKYLESFFRENDIRYTVFFRKRERGNIIARVGKGKARKLLIACHTDTVPPGAGWKRDPFKMVIKGGKAYGLGVCDNKGPVASSLMAAKALKEMEGELNVCVEFGFFADEERGSENGIIYALKNELISASASIVPDIGHNLRAISVGEKGLLHLKIKSRGVQAHASSPQKGVNAIDNLIDFLYMLRAYSFKVKESEGFSEPTISIGRISGGNAVNVVPSYAEAEVDVRYLPGDEGKEIVEDFKKLYSLLRMRRDKMDITIEPIHASRPFIIKRNEDILRRVRKAMLKVTGKQPEIIGLSGTTMAKFLNHHGIKAVGIGVGNSAHEAEENVSVKELLNLMNVFIEVAKGF